MPTSRILAFEAQAERTRWHDPVDRRPLPSELRPTNAARFAAARRGGLAVGALVAVSGLGLATAPAAESSGPPAPGLTASE